MPIAISPSDFAGVPELPFDLPSLEGASSAFASNAAAWESAHGSWNRYDQLVPADGWSGQAAAMAQAAHIALAGDYAGFHTMAQGCHLAMESLIAELGPIKSAFDSAATDYETSVNTFCGLARSQTHHSGGQLQRASDAVNSGIGRLNALCAEALRLMQETAHRIAGLAGQYAVVAPPNGPSPLAVVINENPVAFALATGAGMAPVGGVETEVARHSKLVNVSTDSPLLQSLLKQATSPQARSILSRTAATGATPQDLAWLAALIAGKSPSQLRSMFSVVGNPAVGGLSDGLSQDYSDCGLATTEVVEAQRDPLFALFLTGGGNVDDPWTIADGGKYDTAEYNNARLAFDQMVKMQESGVGFNPDASKKPDGSGLSPYNEQGGITNQQLQAELNSYSDVTGLHYSDTSFNGSGQQLSQVVSSVRHGDPVPLIISNGNEGHVISVIGASNGMLELHDTATGFTGWITDHQFTSGNVGPWTGANGKPLPASAFNGSWESKNGYVPQIPLQHTITDVYVPTS